jgi:predicted MFS family arabinose efflux permease
VNTEKLWTKNFISITVISFFIFFAFYVLLVALPLYLVGTLNLGADKVGLVVTLFLLAAILIRPFAGKWVSQGSQKKILVYSTVAFLLATALYPFATNIEALLALRVFHGLIFGVITTVKGTICAELIPASRRGEGLSYFSLAMNLAMVLGPYIGLYLANMNAYNTAFVVCMILSAINIVLALFMQIPKVTEQLNTSVGKAKFSWDSLFDKKAAPFALAIFILACGYSGVSAFLPLYAKSLGLVEAAGSFFLVYAASIMISRPFTGRWSDQWGAKVIIYPCLLLFAVGMFLLSQAHSSAMILLSGAIIGLGYGSITPIFQTQIISSVEPHRVGIANSLYFNSMDAGMAIGAYALGMVASASNYSSIYLIGVALILVGAVQYFALTRTEEVVKLQPEASFADRDL